VLFSTGVLRYRRTGTETEPVRLVCAPFSKIVNPGVNSVTRSPRRLSDGVKLTLSVTVSCMPNVGWIRQVSAELVQEATASSENVTAAAIGDRRVETTRLLTAPATRLTLLSDVVPVVAIIGADIRLACLVEQHQDDVAIFDCGKGLIQGVMGG